MQYMHTQETCNIHTHLPNQQQTHCYACVQPVFASMFLHLCFTSIELLLRGRPPLIVTSVSSLSLLSAKVNMEVWYKLTENVNMDMW